MAYCGRPSAACHACREKRGKCDKRKPGCGQCARKRIPCPGYRDPATVIIRDQTVATVNRVRKRRDKKAKQAKYNASIKTDLLPTTPVNEHTPGLSDHSPTDVYSTATTAIPDRDKLTLCSTFTLAPEDAAISFFLSFYAPTCPMAYLSVMATSSSLSDMLPMSAMLAPALAMLSHEVNQPSLMSFARMRYAAAIKETNIALMSAQLAITDATLASVLLLALFEAIAFQRSTSAKSWMVHVYGAVELIKLRGPRQFESALGRALFVDVSNNVYALCAQRRVAPPAAISELRAYLGSIIGEDSPEVGLGHVADSMAKLLARMTVVGADRLDHEAVVHQGGELSAKIAHLMKQLEEICPYDFMCPADTPSPAYQDVAHHYQTPQAARHWNILRMMKLFVNKWIHRAATAIEDSLLNGDDTHAIFPAKILESATTDAQSMVVDILRSVTYFQCLPSSIYSNKTVARWLIWPLSAVATSSFATDSAQKYARDSLQTLGEYTGIPQAAEAINMVDEQQSMEDWLHLCHLS
ncbi:conserved hypothetical protein [Talaromyces stipitatus ATCC 10500]|uniref:Zn(2)-C6 fungal-type domain-containing protein n=1 Tax=Talaromyces stipitatus (strain ATCC 10500 / CBS 375.48 / QM 6759 / NRRL 1006) TaxID=441959 RepID=B8MJR2_TALSN|nr:uncharacterized protein TSTA_042040 [Talaromyces stipitatus ATCC 10500]EED14729.1 conserved hypothetical protein [Talaromyces stipitatus ATCC 10500]